ncbi:657_t:CDS:10 [Ambispora gerdemannii]|uniref:657_t:CDS:1 n=1 Tax=Ambispora gerdemannii TaxID=144530 RepID=A0A9N8ZFH0_9GLOM|nr:657_t:CDS:10 [Ambispora gerdemannii]
MRTKRTNRKAVATKASKGKTDKQVVVLHSDGSKSFLETVDVESLSQSNKEKTIKRESRNEYEKIEFMDVDSNDEEVVQEKDIGKHDEPISLIQSGNKDGEDESDEFEEVVVPEYEPNEAQPQYSYDNYVKLKPEQEKTIEITFSAPAIKARGISKMDRVIRTGIHKIHVMSLLAHGMIRNRWCNDTLTQALLCSLIPASSLEGFSKNVEDHSISDLKILLDPLCSWWRDYFDITRLGICSRDYNEFGVKGVSEENQKDFADWVPSVHALRTAIKEGKGSKDTSAQLFVALLRSLGFSARLIISLQAVSFKFAAKKPAIKKTPVKRKNSFKVTSKNNQEDEVEEESSIVYTQEAKRKRSINNSSSCKKVKTESKDKIVTTGKVSKYFTTQVNQSNASQSKESPSRKMENTDSDGSEDEKGFTLLSRTRSLRSYAFQTKNETPAAKDQSENDESSEHSDSQPSTKKSIRRSPRLQKTKSRALKIDSSSENDEGKEKHDEEAESDYYEPIVLIETKEVADDFKPPSPNKSRARANSSAKAKNNSNSVTEYEEPPVYWCELYSEIDKRWFCVDPIRAIIDDPHAMEPVNSSTNNVMAYVVAFEKDLFIKDVTRRYASKWGAHTRKLRIQPTKNGYDWWQETLNYRVRFYETERDKLEDKELSSTQISEAIPTTISAFNNHPLYVLERHLKKFEILHPKEPILGEIRGEPIYPRECVKQLHTVETWLKDAREIKEGEQPLKYVKARAVTLSKKKTDKMSEYFGDAPRESGLYAEWQTVPYNPKHIIDGKIPVNTYGNVDMFQPSMCPIGAVHIPIRGIAKVAKKLEIEFAEAVTGFDFHCHRCIPIVEGIVVAKENEEVVLEAWREHSEVVAIQEAAKRRKKALTRWRKLVVKMRIRLRVSQQFAEKIEERAESGESEFEHDDEDELMHDDNEEEEEKQNKGKVKEVDDYDDGIKVQVGEPSKYAGGFIMDFEE